MQNPFIWNQKKEENKKQKRESVAFSIGNNTTINTRHSNILNTTQICENIFFFKFLDSKCIETPLKS